MQSHCLELGDLHENPWKKKSAEGGPSMWVEGSLKCSCACMGVPDGRGPCVGEVGTDSGGSRWSRPFWIVYF